MTRHVVAAHREGPWWVFRISGLDTTGQAASLADVENEARGIIRAWIAEEAGDVDVRVLAMVNVDVTPWRNGYEIALNGETITQVDRIDGAAQQVRDYLGTIDPDSDYTDVDVHLHLKTPSTLDGGRLWQARAHYEDGWWIITVPELDHLTQARAIGDIDTMARDLIATVTNTDARSISMAMAITDHRAHAR